MIDIQIDKTPASYTPDEPISGSVSWTGLGENIERIEIRLIWFTQGKGNRDVGVVDKKVVETTMSAGSEQFEFAAPSFPYAFSGKLISVVWSIEAIVFPQEEAQQAELVIGPNGQEVELYKSTTQSGS